MITQKIQGEVSSAIHNTIRTGDKTHLVGFDWVQLEQLNELPEVWVRDIIAGLISALENTYSKLPPALLMQKAWDEWIVLRQFANDHSQQDN